MSDDGSKTGCGCLLLPIVLWLAWLLIRLVVWIGLLPGRFCDACSAYDQWNHPWDWLFAYYDHVIVRFVKLPLTTIRLFNNCVVDGWHVQALGAVLTFVFWGAFFMLCFGYGSSWGRTVVWRAIAILLVAPLLLAATLALVFLLVSLAGGALS